MAHIERIPGGLRVDGLELRRAKWGCGGMGGDCGFTYARVSHHGNAVTYEGKATAPSTTNNYQWGYQVPKGDLKVTVKMLDTRDHQDFFAGVYPSGRKRAGRWLRNIRGRWPNKRSYPW